MTDVKDHNLQLQIIDHLHSINAKINRTLRDVNTDIPINLNLLRDIRDLTFKIESLNEHHSSSKRASS